MNSTSDSRHPGGKQLCANIIVDIERAVSLGRGHIAENQLRQIILFGFVPDTQNIVDAGIQLAVRVIRGERIHQPLVKADLRPSEVIFSILSTEGQPHRYAPQQHVRSGISPCPAGSPRV